MARTQPEEVASSDLDAAAAEDGAVADDVATAGANCVAATLSLRSIEVVAATACSLSYP